MVDVNIDVIDGALGQVPSSGDEVHAVIGCSSLGLTEKFVFGRDPVALVASRGYGPGVQAAAFNQSVTGLPLLFARVPTATAGLINGQADAAVNIASSTNATPIVVTTSAPHGRADNDQVTIASHLVNTAANGTWRIDVLSPTTFSLIGSIGVGIGTTSGTVVNTGINVQTSTGTSKPTVSGTPFDSMRFRWKWVTLGTRGTAGATAQYSCDGGATYSAVFPIGAATSYAIPNTGVTIAFSTGTWIAGDEYRWNTTEPRWIVADVIDTIEELRKLKLKFRLIQLVGDMTASDAVTLDLKLEALADQYRFAGLLGNARDFVSADTDEDGWIASLASDYSSFASTRISATGGHYRVTSPIDARKYRRPLSWAAGARIMSRPIQENAGRVKSGKIRGLDSPSQDEITRLGLDADLYHDSGDKPGLASARLFTAKQRVGRAGWYVDQPRMMAQPSSDYQDWPHRSVIDKACDITYEVLVDELNDDIDLDPATGFLTEKAARAIELKLASAYRDGLTGKGACSAVSAVVNRNVNIITTKRLVATIRVTPKGYVQGVDVSVGYTNPALQLAA